LRLFCAGRSSLALLALLRPNLCHAAGCSSLSIDLESTKGPRTIGGELAVVNALPTKPKGMHWRRYGPDFRQQVRDALSQADLVLLVIGPDWVGIPASALKRIGKRRCDMCNGRFGPVRQRFGCQQFCCRACLDKCLSCATREAHRSNAGWSFWLPKNDARSVSRVTALKRQSATMQQAAR
jgi:hypothetical protein